MKIEIRFYDKKFNWIGVINLCRYLQFKRELYGVGTFELQVSLNTKGILELCKIGNIIVINGDGKKSGIIRGFTIEKSRGNSVVTINGHTGDGLTTQKIVVPPTASQDSNALGWEKVSGNAETVIKHFINRNMYNAYDKNRNIENLIVAENTNFGKTFPWKARYTNLAEELENICSYAQVGYSIYADIKNKKWVFDILRGKDRTKSQQEISPVVFRTEYSNIEEFTYTEDYLDYANTGYAGGYGEDEKRLMYILNPENKDVDRFETFLDCSNNDNITDLMYYAKQKMVDYEPKKTIELLTLPRTFIFEDDYFLGDKVSVYIDKLGLEIDVVVTSVIETWEREGGYICELRLGDKVPNIFSIKNKEAIR